MPQYRKLYLKTTESLDINEMPDDFTRLLWLLLPLITCREGRGMDNPAWVKAKAMPLREDVKPEQVERAMAWYAAHDMITRYQVDGRGYFQIVNWSRYQGDTSREAVSNYPGQDQVNGADDSRPTHDLLTTNSCSYTNTDTNTDTEIESDEDTQEHSDLQSILYVWKLHHPHKPQPKPTTKTLQRQAKTRMKNADFREGWNQAMIRAGASSFLKESGWFDLYWFLKNDDNWRKCLAGNYDDKKNGNGLPKTATPVPEGMYTSPDDEFAYGGAS